MTLMFSATPSGVEAHMGRRELAVLDALPALLASISTDDDEDPAVDRLFPPAYDDAAAAEEFRRFAGSEILRARERDREVFDAVLERLGEGPTVMTTEETESCMRTIGAARIALAARHGMFDQDSFDRAMDTPHGTIVAFLGLVQDELVAVLGDVEAVRDG